MATNKEAKSKIRKAINVLQDVLFSEKASPAQRKRVKFVLNLLFDAFNQAAGLPQNLSYKDAAGFLKAASGRLEMIKQERDQLANNLATAAKILGAVNRVLKLAV